MTIHLRQTWQNCGATAAAMACGMTEEEYSDLLKADGRYASSGTHSDDIYQLLSLNGIMGGMLPTYGVEPIRKDKTIPTAKVGVDRGRLSGLRVLAAREGLDIEDLLDTVVADYLKSKGFSEKEISWAPENGIDGDDDIFKNPDGFLVRIPLTTPALVFLNTAEGFSYGHCAYWDGEQLFDPDKDAPTPCLEGYSIRMWVPLIDIGKPRRNHLETFDRLERARQHRARQSSTDEPQEAGMEFCKIRMLRDCFVGEVGGSVQPRSIGDELIVTRAAADDLLNGFARPPCEVLSASPSLDSFP